MNLIARSMRGAARAALLACSFLLAACDGGPARPAGPPASIVAVELPSTVPVHSVATASVRVVDAEGQAVPGAPVALTVTNEFSGAAGDVARKDTVTDEEGIARITWTTSDAVRLVRFRASSGTLATIVVSDIQYVAGPVAKIPGAYLSSTTVGTSPPQAVVASVFDAYGNKVRVAGTPVTFSVTGGGGSVSSATVPTDANGDARVTWTLGPSEGLNTLVATVGSVSGTFTAYAVLRSASLAVKAGTGPSTSIGRPTVGDAPLIEACLLSTSTVTSVRAMAADRVADLARTNATCSSGAGIIYSGALSLAGLPFGVTTIKVAATNSGGATASDIFEALHDNPPALTWNGTADSTLANPTISVTSACTDDDPAGCTSLVLTDSATGKVLASGTSSVSGTISLAEFDGKNPVLLLTGTASNGAKTVLKRQFFVETAPLTPVTTVHGLPVFDYEPRTGRLLYATYINGVTCSQCTSRYFTIRTPGQADVTFPDISGVATYVTRLTPNGAIIAVSNPGFGAFYQMLNGAFSYTPSGTLTANSVDPLAIYGVRTTSSSGVWRRELATGAETQVGPGGITGSPTGLGDVAYESTGHDIYFYSRTGVTTRLTNDNGAYVNADPVTDGLNVLYVKRADSVSGGTAIYRQRVMLHDGAREVELTTTGRVSALTMNSGWAAFIHAPSATPTAWHVYVRSPSGQVTDLRTVDVPIVYTVTPFPPTIEALGSDGTVIVRVPYPATNPGLYRVGPASTWTRIASGAASVIWREGTFYVLRNGVYRTP